MSEFKHPMRDAPLHVFKRVQSDGKGYDWIAKFYPYNTYPIYHHGDTEQEAVDSAEAMREEAIVKYEKDYITRKEALKKAAETRKRKKATKDEE